MIRKKSPGLNQGRKDDFNDDEIDENGTIIDDDDNSWVDETIVVEDGFKDGEKVIGEFVSEDETAVFSRTRNKL